MKHFIFLIIGITFLSCNAQIKIKTYSKDYCVQKDDTQDCQRTKENSIFRIDKNYTSVIHYGEVETTYHIDNKSFDTEKKIWKFEVHTESMEKLKIELTTSIVLIQSITYPEISLKYKIK